jgi:hypothetical protein
MNSFEHRLPTTVSQIELIALVDTLNADTAVDSTEACWLKADNCCDTIDT